MPSRNAWFVRVLLSATNSTISLPSLPLLYFDTFSSCRDPLYTAVHLRIVSVQSRRATALPQMPHVGRLRQGAGCGGRELRKVQTGLRRPRGPRCRSWRAPGARRSAGPARKRHEEAPPNSGPRKRAPAAPVRTGSRPAGPRPRGHRQEHEAGGRNQTEDPVLRQRSTEGLLHRVELVRPHASAVHHGDHVLGLGIPCAALSQGRDVLQANLDGEAELAEHSNALGRCMAELDCHDRRGADPRPRELLVCRQGQCTVTFRGRQAEAGPSAAGGTGRSGPSVEPSGERSRKRWMRPAVVPCAAWLRRRG